MKLKIKDISETIPPKGKVKASNYRKDGKYPIIDQGQDFISGRTDEECAFKDGPYVLFGDHTCSVKYADFPFVQGADGLKVLKSDEDIACPKYLYYFIQSIPISSSYERHWKKMKEEYISVPPLPEQNGIVAKLDAFSLLSESISKRISAEIELNEKRYGYWRDRLLSFRRKEA